MVGRMKLRFRESEDFRTRIELEHLPNILRSFLGKKMEHLKDILTLVKEDYTVHMTTLWSQNHRMEHDINYRDR
ncbi:hypothetical protein CUMW_008470 [Citrus unshiu]|nr:hypothetical protein CUMW_008470 [Citrus unshiu]